MKELLNIYFGVIGNEDIENVKVQDAKNCNVYKEAKIIDTGEIRIWLVYMEGLKGSQFDVVRLSKDEKELTRVSEVVVYSILYSTNNTSMFFKSNINSIFNNQFWFSMTFIQYIILIIVVVALVYKCSKKEIIKDI